MDHIIPFGNPDEFHNEPCPELDNWLKWISSRVQEARLKRGWTIKQLAHIAKLPEKYIELVEAGLTSPSHFARKKMADVLECDEDFLEGYKIQN